MAMSAYASGMYGCYSGYDRNLQPYTPFGPLAPPPAIAQQSGGPLLFG